MSDELQLKYDLFALPTAQHRAGLAGLLVILDCMRGSGLRDVPSVVLLPSGEVQLALTRSSLTALFNYLYDARTEEERTQTRRTGKTDVLLREDEEVTTDKRGKATKRKAFMYEVVKPRAHFLEALRMPDIWVRLWGDIMLRTVRSIYMQKAPYRRRVAGQDAQPGSPTWDDLIAQDEPTIELSRSLFLGAEAHSADNVPFCGRPAETLLLHFWPVVMGMGEIWRLRLEKEEGSQKRRPREERLGYLITVPDVYEVDGFVDEFKRSVGGLGTKERNRRPVDAVLSSPAEGGLEYLHQLTAIAREQATQGDIGFTVSRVDVYVLEPGKNAAAVIGSETLVPRPGLVGRYAAIRGQSRNLLFRAQLIRNLLDDHPWYAGFDRLFDGIDKEFFLGEGARSFALDARRRLDAETQRG